MPLFTVELSGERDRGRLVAGRFTQTLVGTRLRVNLSPDLSVAGYVRRHRQRLGGDEHEASLDVSVRGRIRVPCVSGG